MKTDALLKILKIQDFVFSLHNISEIKAYLYDEISTLPGISKISFTHDGDLQPENGSVVNYPIHSNNNSFGNLSVYINNWTEFGLYEHYFKNLAKIIGFVLHENCEKPNDVNHQSITTSNHFVKADHIFESQERVIELMKSVKLFFIVLNKSGQIIHCNNYFLCQTGYLKEELIQQNWFEIFLEPHMVEKVKADFHTSVINGDQHCNLTESFLTKDEDKIWVSWNNSFLFDHEKKIVGVVCFGENISQRKIAEDALLSKNEAYKRLNKKYLTINEELKDALQNQKGIIDQLEEAKTKAEESDRLKTAFLQNMSHEIRTPMNAIMGFSELLAFYYNDKEKLEHFSKIINQRCEDLLIIINDILDIAKIESGQHNVKPEECNLEDLFYELKSFFMEFQKRVNKENIEFRIIDSCPTEGCIIITDKIKLKQILINLINNAYKFTDNGSIEVGCKLKGNDLHFYVSDTGIGIPPEKQKIIFDRFTQVQFDIKNGGTGLGLSIVKGLVNLLGGNINLKSEYGKGSTFSFTIPYVKSKDVWSIKIPLIDKVE